MRDTEESAAIRYISDLFAPEDAHLRGIRDRLRRDGKLGINVSAHEGRILQVLLRLIEARSVIEIGTLYGYSTLWMARALPAEGRILSLEASEAHYSVARELLSATEVASRVELRLGPALEALRSLGGPFDAVFIDADKAGYARYLDWAEAHVRTGGLIVGDNSLLWGGVYAEDVEPKRAAAVSAMREFNRRLADRERYDSILLPTAEGLTVARKRF